MTSLGTITKDPDAEMPYSIDWTDWLPTGEASITASWDVDDPPDVALVVGTTGVNGLVATARVSGGTEGSVYRLRCRVTSSPSSYVDDRTIVVRVESR